MKFFKLSILVVFVLVLLGSVIPFNKADAQVFTSVCGYDESTNSDILCNYEIEIEEGNNPPEWSTIHINFIFLSSTSDLVGNPSFVKRYWSGDLYSFNQNACNGSDCFQGQQTTNGNGGVVDVTFRWDTGYGVYQYVKNILYTINGFEGAIHSTINANPVNSSSGDVTITFTSSLSGNYCRLYDWNWITGMTGNSVLATGNPSGTYNASIDSDKGYYVNCYNESWPESRGGVIIVNKVPLVEPTVELSFDQERGVRDLVRKETTALEGTTHLRIYVSGLPTGENCVLKNDKDGETIEELETFTNYLDFRNRLYSELGSNNSFYLDCSNPADDTPLLNVKGQSGTLSGPASCIIPVGQRYCTNVPLTWNTINPINGPTTQIINDDEDQVLATGNSATQQGVTLPYSGGSVTIKAVNYISGYVNVGDSGDAVENEIADRITILTSCAEGSGWNGTACAPNAPASSDLTASVPPEYLVMVNTPVNFTSMITNQGNVSTGNTFYNKFQVATSANGGGTISDIISPTYTHSTPSPMAILTAGSTREAVAVNYTFTTTGTRSVRACADHTSLVDERDNEGNNCSSWTNVNVNDVQVRDLTASAPPQTEVVIGTPINFTSIISNIGNISSGGSFYNSFQFATGTDGSGPIFPLIGSTPNPMPTLDAGGSATATSFSQTFAGPARTISVRACADNNTAMSGQRGESNENNNCSGWRNIEIINGAQSDLVSSLTSPVSVVRGVATSFFATITNQGDASTVDPFINLFQTSTEPNGGGTVSDFPTNTAMLPLPAGQYETAQRSITFGTSGTYYMRACADRISKFDTDGVIDESNELNNCGGWYPVTVADPSMPDLGALETPQTSATVNVPINFTSVIYNNGSGSTGGSFYNLFQVSTSAGGLGLITPLNSTPSPMQALLAGGYATATSVTYTFTSEATYSVRACADKNTLMMGTIPESDEINNCSKWTDVKVNPAPGLPDLMASAPTETSATIASPINFTSLIKNEGLSSTVIPFTNLFQVATGVDGTGNIHQLSSTPNPMPALDVNQGMTATSSTHTFNGPPRTVSVRACGDMSTQMSGVVTESNENNNCSGWANVSIGCAVGMTWNGTTCEISATAISGTLTGSSCNISLGGSTCTTNLSWSIDNTEAVPSAITANGMTDISLSTPTIGNDYSGNKTV